MFHYAWPISLMLCLLAVVAGARAEAPEDYPFISYETALKRAAGEDKKIFLYLGREGCGWCEKTNKEAFSDPRVKETYSEHYLMVYVDSEGDRRITLPTGEQITEMELGARLKALATPIFIYLESDGSPIFKVLGVQSSEDFMNYHRYISSGAYRDKTFNQFHRGEAS